MRKRYVTDEWNIIEKGHSCLDFIDVNLNSDNKLFIDPCLIYFSNDKWSECASFILDSYFTCFYTAYSKNDARDKIQLLSYAGEQNGTKLGYGNGHNGKGNTVEGLLDIFTPLEKLIYEIKSINNVVDLPVLIPGFAEDGLSDLITNILHLQLNEFTLIQMQKYGIESNGNIKFMSWNALENKWCQYERPTYYVSGKELLLVPKNIVRNKYLFSTGQYFTRIIIDRIRESGGYCNEDGDKYSKKDIVKSLRFSDANWKYKNVITFTKNHNDALEEYHHKLRSFYFDRQYGLSDEQLDMIIYGHLVKQIA